MNSEDYSDLLYRLGPEQVVADPDSIKYVVVLATTPENFLNEPAPTRNSPALVLYNKLLTQDLKQINKDFLRYTLAQFPVKFYRDNFDSFDRDLVRQIVLDQGGSPFGLEAEFLRIVEEVVPLTLLLEFFGGDFSNETLERAVAKLNQYIIGVGYPSTNFEPEPVNVEVLDQEEDFYSEDEEEDPRVAVWKERLGYNSEEEFDFITPPPEEDSYVPDLNRMDEEEIVYGPDSSRREEQLRVLDQNIAALAEETAEVRAATIAEAQDTLYGLKIRQGNRTGGLPVELTQRILDPEQIPYGDGRSIRLARLRAQREAL